MKAQSRVYKEVKEQRHPCEIYLDNDELVVRYHDYDYNYIPVIMEYRGREVSPGHFLLHEKKFNFEARVHTMDYTVFDGWYNELDEKGMWQIICDKPLKKGL